MTTEIGKITKWNDEKGFGFISPKETGRSVFIHINDFSKRHKRPTLGLSVTYNLSKDSKGRICAKNVCPEKGHKRVTKAGKQKTASLFISSAFLLVVAGLVYLDLLPIGVLGFYLAISLLTFGLYAKDKSAAQSGGWRTSERTLHLISLIGGWPGALIAQSQLRHKSKKLSFRIVYGLTIILNCCILGWLLTPEGNEHLENILKQIRDIDWG
tara:strand:- start:133 stop:768 length:636 start_codon:yes stop_codon:yes gene_type:complete